MTITPTPFPPRAYVRTVPAMPSVTISIDDASALALVLSAAEADAATTAVRIAAGDALDLLQHATAGTAGPEYVPLLI